MESNTSQGFVLFILVLTAVLGVALIAFGAISLADLSAAEAGAAIPTEPPSVVPSSTVDPPGQAGLTTTQGAGILFLDFTTGLEKLQLRWPGAPVEE